MQLVFPYRGTYVRHVGGDEVVADASQVLFFHAGEEYQVSHPNPGGDASLALTVDEALLREVAPPALLRGRDPLRFRALRLRIDARAQVLVALLRHALHEGIAEPLEGESLALTLVHRALAPRTTHAAASSHGRGGSSTAQSWCSRAISRGAGHWPRWRRKSGCRRSI
ncbi:MAG TPA: hypothetical protein VHL61_02145 [Luteimonas sp.]|jgi:hypothetical protein|nr:hypothetical protein [Luteimonas sp.]